MKSELFLFCVILAIAILIYFGYMFVVQKSMHPEKDPAVPIIDPVVPVVDPAVVAKKQKQNAEETWEKQRLMMENQKQRMRDLQRR